VAKKTLVKRVDVDEAQRAHGCQRNSAHRLERGDKRLKVWKGRSPEHYCRDCAKQIIARDREKLDDLERRLDATPGTSSPASDDLGEVGF
jgi:hypothetical protein